MSRMPSRSCSSRQNCIFFDRKDTEGKTPLSVAAMGGHEYVVRILLRAAPDTTVSKRAVLVAATSGHHEIVRMVLPRLAESRDDKEQLSSEIQECRKWHKMSQEGCKFEVQERWTEVATLVRDGQEYLSQLTSEDFNIIQDSWEHRWNR